MTGDLVLVTGGGGFVGSHVVDALVTAGFPVRVVDNFNPAAHAGVPDALRDDVDHVVGDLADDEIARTAVDGVSHVCHQAAMVGLGVDFGDVRAYAHHNVLATASLLGALHARGFAGRFVLASSMVVYGEGRYRCAEHGVVRPGPRRRERLEAGSFEPECPRCGTPLQPEPIAEDAPTDPRNVYAATKLHQEHLCRSFESEHPEVVVTALRYHNVYGPMMPSDTPYAGVAGIFRSALARGEPPRLFEDGGQLRDFVHVRDVARANLRALTATTPYPGALNVASGKPRSVGEMANALADAFGPDAPRPRVVGGYRAGDVRHVFASPGRAREVLGFSAAVSFEDGMRELARAPSRTPPAARPRATMSP